MATIFMKTTVPNIIPMKYDGLTQDEINILLDNLGHTAYEIINETEYNTLIEE